MNKNTQRLSAIAHGQLERFECKKTENRKRITSKTVTFAVELLRFVCLGVVEVAVELLRFVVLDVVEVAVELLRCVVLDVVEVESCKEKANSKKSIDS